MKPDFDKKMCALWGVAGEDETELARVANDVVKNDVSKVSVVPGAVPVLWTWLEKNNKDIYARFYLEKMAEKYSDKLSMLIQNINTAFKQGAYGAQVFMHMNQLTGFVNEMHVIRDDLFFNRDMSIGIDIMELSTENLTTLFEGLNKINATSLILVMTRDDGDMSDFVGRLYGVLSAWGAKCDLHFALGNNFVRMEQALRLVAAIRPQLMERMSFFVTDVMLEKVFL